MFFKDDLTPEVIDFKTSWKPKKERLFYFQIRDHCPYGSLQDMLQKFNELGYFSNIKEEKELLEDKTAQFYAGEIIEFLERAHVQK